MVYIFINSHHTFIYVLDLLIIDIVKSFVATCKISATADSTYFFSLLNIGY